MERVLLANYAKPDDKGRKFLNWSAIAGLLRSKDFATLRDSADGVLFSLRNFKFVNPDGLVWLLLVADYFKSRGLPVWLDLPDDDDVLRQIKECNFEEGARTTLSITNLLLLDGVEGGKSPQAMQFQRIDSQSLSGVISKVSAFVSTYQFAELVGIEGTDLAAEYLDCYLGIIVETAKNVVQHSGAVPNSGLGYLMLGRLGRNNVRFCVGDSGIGLASSLSSKGIVARHDMEAIKHALLFRYHKPGGEGLFRVVQFVSRLGSTKNPGLIRIRSGRADLFLRHEQILRSDEETKAFIEALAWEQSAQLHFPGVQVQIDLVHASRRQ